VPESVYVRVLCSWYVIVLSPTGSPWTFKCEKSANPVQEKLGGFEFVVWKQDSESTLILTEAFSLVLASMISSKIPSPVLAPSVIGTVTRACTSNPATLLIPCHPVVRKNDELGGYRWGIGLKKALLRVEETLPAKLKC